MTSLATKKKSFITFRLLEQIPEDSVNVENLGIWIDPIGKKGQNKLERLSISDPRPMLEIMDSDYPKWYPLK